MHFHENKAAGCYIKAYEEGQLFINDQIYTTPIIIFQDQLHQDLLPAQFDQLAIEHVKALIQLNPELILLGTGERQQFLEHELLAPFSHKKIGIEVMNTLSAARTFNLLREDGRKVLGAFFP